MEARSASALSHAIVAYIYELLDKKMTPDNIGGLWDAFDKSDIENTLRNETSSSPRLANTYRNAAISKLAPYARLGEKDQALEWLEGLHPNALTGWFASKKNWPSIICAAISASQIPFALQAAAG